MTLRHAGRRQPLRAGRASSIQTANVFGNASTARVRSSTEVAGDRQSLTPEAAGSDLQRGDPDGSEYRQNCSLWWHRPRYSDARGVVDGELTTWSSIRSTDPFDRSNSHWIDRAVKEPGALDQ